MRVFKDFFYIFCGIFLGRLFNFLSGVLIARIAGAESIGDYTLFMTVFVVTSESTGVIDTTLIKFCSKQLDKKNEVLKCAFLMKFFYSLLFVSISLGIRFLFLDTAGEYWRLVFGAGISGCLFSFYMIHITWNQLNLNYIKVGLLQFLCQFFGFVFIALGLLIGFYGSTYLFSLYLIIGAAFASFSIWSHIDSIKSKILNPLLKKFLSTSLILISAAVVNQVSNRLDVFFITFFFDKADIGYYGAALRATSIMTLFTAATRILLTPKAPGAVNNFEKRKKYFQKTIIILIIQFILLIIVATFARDLIMLLYGERYIASINVLRILIIQVLVGSAVVPFQALIQVGPRPKEIVKINFIKLFLGGGCSIALIPALGLAGAAMVGIITNVFLLYSFISIQKKIDSNEQSYAEIL